MNRQYFYIILSILLSATCAHVHAQNYETIISCEDSMINEAGDKVKFVSEISLRVLIKCTNGNIYKEASFFGTQAANQTPEAIAEFTQSDSVFIVADNKSKRTFTYKVLIDGQTFADNQTLRIKNDECLAKGLEQSHKYIISIKDNKNRNYLTITHFSYPTPKSYGIFFPEQRPSLLSSLSHIGKLTDTSFLRLPRTNWKAYGNVSSYLTATVNNDSVHYPLSINIPYKHNRLIYLMGELTPGAWYEYKIINQDKEEDSTGWISNDPDNKLVDIKFEEPGSYTVKIRYDSVHYSRSRVLKEYVTLRPAWYQTHFANFMKGFFIGNLIILLPAGIFFYARKRKKKLRELQHKMTDLQLQSYRNQLNPHFIFNALSSIQSLINKNDADNANTYLTEFSTLLRMTLDPKKAKHWTLEDELQLLDKYIHLEQLRFQFKYTVQNQKDINMQVSFPAMLLQPIVENAVKHGISKYQQQGALAITLNAALESLIITISDNGSGFYVNEIGENSHGIRLTRERIAFLNETNKEQSIILTINSTEQGTEVILHFNHYLHG